MPKFRVKYNTVTPMPDRTDPATGETTPRPPIVGLGHLRVIELAGVNPQAEAAARYAAIDPNIVVHSVEPV